MACLDTTVFIDLGGRGGRRMRDRAQAAVARLLSAGELVVTTRFTLAELYVGAQRAPDPVADLRAIDMSVAPFQILEFEDAAARQYGVIKADRDRRGLPVGDMDLLIAAVATVHGHRVVTRNVNDFTGMLGVTIETY